MGEKLLNEVNASCRDADACTKVKELDERLRMCDGVRQVHMSPWLLNRFME